MILRTSGSGLVAWGLLGQAAPVSGSMRMTAPFTAVGSAVVRRSWARRAPPSADGGVRLVPAGEGGSPQALP